VHFSLALEPGPRSRQRRGGWREPHALGIPHCQKSCQIEMAAPSPDGNKTLTTRACSRTCFSSRLVVARSNSLTMTANSPLGYPSHCGPTHSLNAIQDERTPCTCSIGELMFGEAIRVPRHNKSLQSWSEANREASVFRDNVVSSEPGIKGSFTVERGIDSPLPASSYAGGINKCNYFVALRIVCVLESAFGGSAKKDGERRRSTPDWRAH